MSTRKTFANEIAGRVRRIGWELQPLNSGGWKVVCPDGFVVQVHLTPSDVNAPKVVMDLLNAHGFEEAEAEWQRLDEYERKEKIDEVHKKAQSALDKAQKDADKRAELLARASGVTRVDEKMLLNPYPVPKAFERVLVTPELAEKLLELNTDNRPIRPHDVAYWSGIIERGEWLYTHQGIAIDTRGVLQDGQHRLQSIAATGIGCEMMISIGMPQENFPVIDTGTRRSGGDVVAKYGLPSRNRVSTIARTIIIYDGLPDRGFSDRVSNTEIDQMVSQWGGTIVDSYNRGQAMYQSFRILATSAGSGIFLLYRDIGKNHPKVEEFINSVISRENLPPGDPRLALQNAALNVGSRTRHGQRHLAMFIKAWNFYVTERSIKFLVWRPKSEEFPRLIIPEDTTE